jgi:hypothetical protein
VDIESLSDEEIAKLPPEVQKLARDLKGNYTQKTQSLSEEKQQLTERYGWYDELVENATSDDPFKQDQAKQMLQSALRQLGGDGAAAPQAQAGGIGQEQLREAYETADPSTRTLLDYQGRALAAAMQRLQTLERNSKAAMDTFASREMQAERTRLAGKYGDISDDVWDAVLTKADQLGVQDLETVFQSVDYDNAGQRARKAAFDGIQQKQKATPRSQSTTPGQGGKKAKTFDEIFAIAGAETARGR